MRRLGVYGGTFSPPHNGHIAAAREFISAAALDLLYVMPAFIPPHKRLDGDDPRRRYEMLLLAFDGAEKTEVSDFELKKGGVSYTYETLAALTAPGLTLCLLTGTDMFVTLDMWKNPDVIFRACEVWTLPRADGDLSALNEASERYRQKYGAVCRTMDVPALDISSTQVRAKAAAHGDISALVPAAVAEYIKRNNLYQ